MCVAVAAAWWWLHGSSQCVSIGARRARGRGPPGALRPSPFDLWLGPHWTSLALWLLPSLPLAPKSLLLVLFFRLSTSIDRANTSFHLLSFFFRFDLRRDRHPFLSCPYQSSTSSMAKSFPLNPANPIFSSILAREYRSCSYFFTLFGQKVDETLT